MALSNDDLFVVQDPLTSKFFKLTFAELSANAGEYAKDGAINIDGGDGITATGDNATANQGVATTRVLSVDTTWLQTWVDANAKVYDAAINFNAGNGLESTGNNATANQQTASTKEFRVKAADNSIDVSGDGISVNINQIGVNDGAINFNAGDGLAEVGNNATANQQAGTTKTFSVRAANASISVGVEGISVDEIDCGEYS